MKRLITGVIACGALATGCHGSSPEGAPAPHSSASAPAPIYPCDVHYNDTVHGHTPADKRLRRLIRKQNSEPYDEVVSKLGNVIIEYDRDCEVAVFTPKYLFLNSVSCEDGQLATDYTSPQDPTLRREAKETLGLLNASQLCVQHVIEPVGDVIKVHPEKYPDPHASIAQ